MKKDRFQSFVGTFKSIMSSRITYENANSFDTKFLQVLTQCLQLAVDEEILFDRAPLSSDSPAISHDDLIKLIRLRDQTQLEPSVLFTTVSSIVTQKAKQ